MPKVITVKSARKAFPPDIQIGDTYYWWSFKTTRGGYKVRSKTYPKQSQLTQSDYLRSVLELSEEISDTIPDFSGIEEFRDEWLGRVQEILDEQQEKLDNMPEGLQRGDTGQLIQARIDSCQQAVDEIQALEIPCEDDFDHGGEPQSFESEKEAWMEEACSQIRDEIQNAIDNIE